MERFAIWAGAILVPLILWELVETMIIPRTVMRPGRFTTLFYRTVGLFKVHVIHRLPHCGLKETLLAAFGPVSLLLLVSLWAFGITVGFAAIHWGVGTRFEGFSHHPSFNTYLYYSGTSLFTLGLGDLAPVTSPGRGLSVLESGLGLGLFAAVVSYLPTLYQAFSAREATIVRLENRCGGTIDGLALVSRYLKHGDVEGLASELRSFEEWTAQLLETTESYPMLAFYRSQHSDRSWVGALVAGLDACAVLRLPATPTWPPRLSDQAEVSYSMAKRALDTLSATLRRNVDPEARRRLDYGLAKRCLSLTGVVFDDDIANERALDGYVAEYEPQAIALARYLALELPEV